MSSILGSFGERRFLSYPHRVRFGGFESTTAQLQACGWMLAVEQDPYRDAIRLLLQHRAADMTMITAPVRYMHLLRAQDQPLDFNVVRAGTRMEVRIIESSFNFKQIDATPQYIDHIPNEKVGRVEDMGIFATPLTRTQEIIVEPDTVSSLLERIKELQLPEQERIRQRKRLAEAREGACIDARPREVFHAQILSIAA